MRTRAFASNWAMPCVALGILALVALPARAQQQAPYDAQDPATAGATGGAGAPAPERRWGPADTPDRSPEDDTEWTTAGPKYAPPPPPPSTSPDRRRYSYEDDPRSERRAAPKKPRHDEEEGDRVDAEEDYPRFGAEAFLWIAKYRGKVERERGGVGTTFRPESESFNLDDVQPGLDVKLVFAPASDWTIEAEYGIAYFDGGATLDQDIDFDGRFYAAGDRVSLAVQNEILAFTAEYTFFARKHFRIGLPFGFAWISQKVRLKNHDTGDDAQDRVDAITPFLGLAIDIPFGGGFGIDGRVRAFGYSGGDERDHISFGFVDVEARLYATIGGTLRIYVGYRFLGVENDQRDRYDDVRGDFGLNAFVAGLGVTF